MDDYKVADGHRPTEKPASHACTCSPTHPPEWFNYGLRADNEMTAVCGVSDCKCEILWRDQHPLLRHIGRWAGNLDERGVFFLELAQIPTVRSIDGGVFCAP